MTVVLYLRIKEIRWTISNEDLAALEARFPGVRFVRVTDDDELPAALGDADVFVGFHFPQELFASASRLRWMHCVAAGVEENLFPAMVASDVVVTNAAGMGRAVDPENPHLVGTYGPWKAYGQSKLANFHFALGLQREFEAAGARARSLVAHPGLSDTELQATSVEATNGGAIQRFFHMLARRTGMTAAEGALPQLRAACDPTARGGEFYAPRFGNSGPAVRRPVLRPGIAGGIKRLWAVSERETGVKLDVGAALASAAT